MSLFACPECNHQVSSTAKSCPNCGHVLTGVDRVAANPNAPRTSFVNADGKPSGKLWLILLFWPIGFVGASKCRSGGFAEAASTYTRITIICMIIGIVGYIGLIAACGGI